DRASDYAQDDGLRGIVEQNDPLRRTGRRVNCQLDDAKLRVDDVLRDLEINEAVVQFQSSKSLRPLHGSEEQRSERQHSDSTGMRAAADRCEGCFKAQCAGFRHLAGYESERAPAHIDLCGRRLAIALEFL